MLRTTDKKASPRRRFLALRELSGGLGDLGLFLPLVVAMALATDMDLGVIFIAAGLMNIATGFLFRQPIPVQPMKAIAAVAITEGLMREDIAAAGICMGLIMICLAFSGLADKLDSYAPKAIVRGIQLGVGLKLAAKGITGISELPLIGLDSVLLAILALVALAVLERRRFPAALLIFLAGFAVLGFASPHVYDDLRLAPPNLALHWPTGSAWTGGFLNGALPQLPLTLLNSVIAVCALSGQYFPGRGITPKRMAASVGIMNLICAPFGAAPMCHGAGGLAAQYRFGARTGGSVVMLGLLKISVGLLLGGSLVGMIQAYPVGILGTMLFLAGFELARSARDLKRFQDVLPALTTAAVILCANTLAGFLAGSGAYLFLKVVSATRKRLPSIEESEKNPLRELNADIASEQ